MTPAAIPSIRRSNHGRQLPPGSVGTTMVQRFIVESLDWSSRPIPLTRLWGKTMYLGICIRGCDRCYRRWRLSCCRRVVPVSVSPLWIRRGHYWSWKICNCNCWYARCIRAVSWETADTAPFNVFTILMISQSVVACTLAGDGGGSTVFRVLAGNKISWSSSSSRSVPCSDRSTGSIWWDERDVSLCWAS